MGSLYFRYKWIFRQVFVTITQQVIVEFDLCRVYRKLTPYPFVCHYAEMLLYYESLFLLIG